MAKQIDRFTLTVKASVAGYSTRFIYLLTKASLQDADMLGEDLAYSHQKSMTFNLSINKRQL